ncbi:MAG: FecR family protein [Chitinophagaceae bacterium]
MPTFLYNMTSNRLTILLSKYADDNISVGETEEMFRLIAETPDAAVREELTLLLKHTQPVLVYDEQRWAPTLARAIERAEVIRKTPPAVPSKLIFLRKLAVAAAITGLIAFAAYQFFQPATTQEGAPAVTAQQTKPIPAPVVSKAIVTLEDGTSIAVDSLSVAAVNKNIPVSIAEDGTLVYEEKEMTAALHTLTNPRGSRAIRMRLSDGTQVWLNAGSSVRYPAFFGAGSRQVEVNGEAYLEVAKDASRPFSVVAGNTITTVLGTYFNVNSYTENGPVKLTLLEGSVRFSAGASSVLLEPGEQGIAGNRLLKIPVDVEEVVAWKNGYFAFTHQSIAELANELARWYDITIHFDPALMGRRFGGGIARDADLQQVILILEETKIKCRLEGRTLYLSK